MYYIGGKLDLTVIRADVLQTIRHERPFTVLVDKDGVTRSLHLAAAGTSLPDEAAFHEQLNWGCAAALMCAKAIVRRLQPQIGTASLPERLPAGFRAGDSGGESGRTAGGRKGHD